MRKDIMRKVKLSEREFNQIGMALCAYKVLFKGNNMPLVDSLIEKFSVLNYER